MVSYSLKMDIQELTEYSLNDITHHDFTTLTQIYSFLRHATFNSQHFKSFAK